jgi:hypothetical protein
MVVFFIIKMLFLASHSASNCNLKAPVQIIKSIYSCSLAALAAQDETYGKQRLLFVAANRKRQTSFCLLKTETENDSLFPLSANDKTIINDCSFSKRAHLCFEVVLSVVEILYCILYLLYFIPRCWPT